ncbi:MAG: O-antigen ligase family protein [Planctomycetes bacterium]|nr:O-antigen ligase family protein [Planctomycetota bacterium]
MRPLLPAGPKAAAWLRRAVLAVGAAAVLVLPQFSTNASFIGVQGLPGPVEVLAIGLALWLMPVLLVSSWVAERRAYLPHAWLTVPAGLFVLGAAVSTAFAADKASAMVRAAEMTGLWVAAWALVQALRTDAERRFLLAAVVAAAAVSAAVAIHQHWFGLPETWEYFQQHREQVLAERGIEPGSWMESLLVARFTGGVQATLGHPNVLASFLTLGLLVAVGLVREKWSEGATRGARAVAVVVGAVAVACGLGIVLTQSRAGEVAAVVGLYWLAVAWWVRRRRARVALYLAPLVVAAVALAVATQVDHPAVAGTLRTLRYRLDYWQATLEVLRAHWDTGVGLENFGLHYVEHKLPWAPEEVADPHNMVLSTWSTLGVAGLVALALLAVGAIRLWRRRPPVAGVSADGSLATGAGAARGQPLTPLLVPALLVAAPVVVYFFAMGHYIGVGVVAVMTMVMALAASEEPSRLEACGRPLRALQAACVAALAAFALEEQIGTAILEPPTVWAMLVVLGVSLGPGRGAGIAPREAPAAGGDGGPSGWALSAPVRFLLMVAAMGLCFLYTTLLIWPVGREQSLLALGDWAGVTDAVGEAALRAASQANPVAWEPAMIRGHRWQQEAADQEGAAAAIALERAITAYREALVRHPRLRRAYLALAACHLSTPGADENPSALGSARVCLEYASQLYPTDVRTRLRLADVLCRLGEAQAALAAYREVRRFDDLMPEAGRRLSAEDRALVEARIGELSGTAPAGAP